jgi:ribosomal RNA-processing protein 9
MAVDSFFANTRKRKRPAKTTSTTQRNAKPQQNRKPVTKKAAAADSDIEGDEEDDHFDANQSTASEAESSDEEIIETAAEKRVRLAKAYLGTIEETLDGKPYQKKKKKLTDLFCILKQKHLIR